MVEVGRDPRWGRIIEGAGEDSYLASVVAAAQVHGFQGDRFGAPERVIAGPKHRVGYGAALGGRDYDEAKRLRRRTMEHLPAAVKVAVDAGTGNILTAYRDLNGIPATGNHWLLTTVLRETWGFDGFAVSDANAVRNLATQASPPTSPMPARAPSTSASTLRWPSATPPTGTLPDATTAAQVTQESIDTCVRRILRTKLQLGLFDNPYVDEDHAKAVLADPAHRDVARTSAEHSAVLLRNRDGLPPLTAAHLTPSPSSAPSLT